MGFWTPYDPEVVNPSDKDGQSEGMFDDLTPIDQLGEEIDQEITYRKKWL